MPASEVMQRYVMMQDRIPDPLRDLYGVAYLVQDLAFVRALLEERAPSPDIRAGLEAQRLAAAVYHAAHTGEEVEVESFEP